MLAKGYIRKSKSPGGSLIFFELKKNGKLRLIVDYYRFNETTFLDSFPILLINYMLECLCKVKSSLKLIYVKLSTLFESKKAMNRKPLSLVFMDTSNI